MQTLVNLHKTDDIYLASYIIAKQALKLAKITVKDEYGRFHFYDPSNKGDALAVELASGGQVPALLFQQYIRNLKTQVHALINRQTARKPSVYAAVR